ncbi:MAG: hypothetical protein WAU23_09250 [Ferruginibacter sp.]
MATHVNGGDSIECNKSLIAVRKISKKHTLINMDSINGEFVRLFKYKSSIRAIVKIKEELDPLACIICQTSHLALEDSLEGEVISIYTKRQIKLEPVSNFSHVHGIQGSNVTDFTYAKIDIPWRYVLERELPEAV